MPHLRNKKLQPPAIVEGHLSPEQDPHVLSGVQPHFLVSGGEDLAEDDLGMDVVGKVKRRHYQLHQVTSALVVANIQ